MKRWPAEKNHLAVQPWTTAYREKIKKLCETTTFANAHRVEAWKKSVERAAGYRELGMLKEAGQEIAQLPVADQERMEVLCERMDLSIAAKEWEQAIKHGKKIVQRQPGLHLAWVNLALAVREARSVETAWTILQEGERACPGHPHILFSMACCASQMEIFKTALRLLEEAIKGDDQFRVTALRTSDLKPLWDHLKEPEDEY